MPNSLAVKPAERAFTVVELIIVMIVIGILAALAFPTFSKWQVNARDDERISDVNSIARQLEAQYRTSAAGGSPTYPSNSGSGGIASISSIFNTSGLRDMATAPGDTSGSISLKPTYPNSANNTSPPTSMSVNEYIYQPFRPDGKLCNYDASPDTKQCVRFILWYKLEATGEIKSIESKHQQ